MYAVLQKVETIHTLAVGLAANTLFYNMHTLYVRVRKIIYEMENAASVNSYGRPYCDAGSECHTVTCVVYDQGIMDAGQIFYSPKDLKKLVL